MSVHGAFGFRWVVAVLVLALAGWGCGGDDAPEGGSDEPDDGASVGDGDGDGDGPGAAGDGDDGAAEEPGTIEEGAASVRPEDMPEESCDSSLRPILFVHGGFGAGDNFELQAMRFSSNGYCRDSLRIFDYDSIGVQTLFNPLGGAGRLYDEMIERLDDTVDQLLADTGFEQIDLVGHSFGTGVSSDYLGVPERAAKIAHYANVAGGGAEKPVPTVNLASAGDLIVGNADVPGADKPDVGSLDHMAILTARASFVEMYRFFNDGEAPEHEEVVAEERITIAGYYRNLGDNQGRAGVTIEVYQVDDATGERLRQAPDVELTTGDDGSFGPFAASPDARYELLLPGGGEGGRDIHMYRAPLKRSTHLMYAKSMPTEGSLAATLLAGAVKYSDERTDLIVQHNHRAMVADEHSLIIDGRETLLPEVAPPARTLIALFGIDENANNQSDMVPITRFGILPIPFLSGIDIALLTDDEGPLEVIFGDTTVAVPRWRGDSDGTVLVLLDE